MTQDFLAAEEANQGYAVANATSANTTTYHGAYDESMDGDSTIRY
jgi:hypothetical protein